MIDPPGARPVEGGVHFRVWAPRARRVDVELVSRTSGEEPVRHRLAAAGDGYFAGVVHGAAPGAWYRYRLDGQHHHADPASRFQPQGVDGPSEVIDPAHEWSAEWSGVDPDGLVVYELHVGTFTPEGTFSAAAERLHELAELGVGAIELMPVAEFPGDRNWGYDGVFLFAPSRAYGSPSDLRRFVDVAHRHGLAVLLDVVYNHFGPEGNVLPAVTGGAFFTDEIDTPWGAAIDFTRRPVRDFFVANAEHWIREYRVDGFRFDATHAIHDPSHPHIIAEVGQAARRAAGDRPVVLIAEDDRNERAVVEPAAEGGWGMDAVWADDFHHAVRRLTAGDEEGYFGDFEGTGAEIARILRDGWLYTGQRSGFRQAPRGTSAEGLPPRAFVHCVQNHDQVGNRALGGRLHHEVDPAVFRASVALLLCSPFTPLLFMGQEWAATSPFLYFTDHPEALGRAVTEGRRREFAHFSAFSDPDAREAIPDPQAEETFRRSRLRWREREEGPHAGVLALHRDLLELRRSHPALCPGADHAATGLGHAAVALGRSANGVRLLVVAVLRGELVVELARDPATAPPGGGAWSLRLATEHERYGGPGSWGGLEADGSLRLAGPGAVVLEAGG